MDKYLQQRQLLIFIPMQEAKGIPATSAKNVEEGGSPSKKMLSGLSPEKYGRSAFRELSYTPEKLYESFMYKENTSNKRVEEERRRVRELESSNTLHTEKIRQLEVEIETINRSLLLQIDMYKKMLEDKEEEKLRHIKLLQEQYNSEISIIIAEREEEARVVQAQKEQLENRVQELQSKIEELSGHVNWHKDEIDELTNNLSKTTLELEHTKEKLESTQHQLREEVGWRDKEISSLNLKIQKDAMEHERQQTQLQDERRREVDRLERIHKEDLDRLENKREAELNEKGLEMKAITAAFEAEARRLEQIMNNKDRVNSTLMADLTKEKDKTVELTKHFDSEIAVLNTQKEHLLREIQIASNEKAHYKIESEQLLLELNAHVDGSDLVIGGLKNELVFKNAELARENDRLLSAVDRYEQEVYMLKGQNKLDRQANVRLEDNLHLVNEVRGLKQILLESSIEMENCKKQFIRLNTEKEKLSRLNRELELQVNQWKDNYYILKGHA